MTYQQAYEAAQAGGMNNTDSHEFAREQVDRRRHRITTIPGCIRSWEQEAIEACASELAALRAERDELRVALAELLKIAHADDIGIDDREARDEWMLKAHQALAKGGAK